MALPAESECEAAFGFIGLCGIFFWILWGVAQFDHLGAVREFFCRFTYILILVCRQSLANCIAPINSSNACILSTYCLLIDWVLRTAMISRTLYYYILRKTKIALQGPRFARTKRKSAEYADFLIKQTVQLKMWKKRLKPQIFPLCKGSDRHYAITRWN